MGYSVLTTSAFVKNLKRLAKKYRSLAADLLVLEEQLLIEPTLGTALGKHCFKIRLAITSKGKGKSGGARVYTYVEIRDEVVYLIAIHDKSDKATLLDHEISAMLKDAGLD